MSDCRRSEEFLGSVREIDRYSPPTGWCIPIGWKPEFEGEGEAAVRGVVDRARVRLFSIS